MTILLDTHAVIWAVYSSRRLSRTAASTIAEPENRMLVSAATAWEVATKVRLGKMPEAEYLAQDFIDAMDDAGYELLPISVEHALRAGRLTGDHKDPFDRILAAQALAADIPVISADGKLDAFGVRRIW